jgi:hypothetical protein
MQPKNQDLHHSDKIVGDGVYKIYQLTDQQEKLMPRPTRKDLNKPWNSPIGVAWSIATLVVILFVVSGIGPFLTEWAQGRVNMYVEPNANGELVLSPVPGSDAALAGIVLGDVLLAINQTPLPQGTSVNQAIALLSGPAGQPVTLTILAAADGQEKTVTITRSGQYLKSLAASGVSLGFVTYYYLGLGLLVALIFIGLSGWTLWRNPVTNLNTLIALTLLVMPYSINIASTASYGATALNMDWLYSLARAGGLLGIALLLFLFPTGKFIPPWGRWAAIVVGVWMIPFYAELLLQNPQFSAVIDWAWIIIFVIGIVAQAIRFFDRETTSQEKLNLMMLLFTGIAALLVYTVIWLVNHFTPDSFVINPAGVWFGLLSTLALDCAAVFFAMQLVPLNKQPAPSNKQPAPLKIKKVARR